MDFQDRPIRKCSRCHEDIPDNPKLTSESEPYCSHCGFVFGTSVAPSSWVCEECGDVILDHGGDERPGCDDCGVPMSCLKAHASEVHGIGVDEELDLGLARLYEAQDGPLPNTATWHRDAKNQIVVREETEQKFLELGSDILRDSQK